MTDKTDVQGSQRPSQKRAEETSEKTQNVEMQKESPKKKDAGKQNKTNDNSGAEVTDKHHDA